VPSLQAIVLFSPIPLTPTLPPGGMTSTDGSTAPGPVSEPRGRPADSWADAPTQTPPDGQA
jgi:hypothetical protein